MLKYARVIKVLRRSPGLNRGMRKIAGLDFVRKFVAESPQGGNYLSSGFRRL